MQDLYNMMEECVEQKLNDILPQMKGYCDCEACRLDMKAYALNRLPAKYVHTDKGAVFQKFDALTAQADTEITTVVIKSIETIGKNPNHS